MKMCVQRCVIFSILTLLLVAGCREASTPSASPVEQAPSASADGQKYLLAQEPAGASSVIAARKEAKDGDAIVLAGRIGGSMKPWVEGRASFWIVDASLSCKEADGTECPDYCEIPRDELRAAMATVKVVDEHGQTVARDARTLLGLKELQTVVVQGQARRDEKGNLTILARAVYVRPDGKN